MSKSISILFVCMGNICRSPTAEGVFRSKVDQLGLNDAIHIDSAGTHAYHIGESPDPRAQEAAESRGFDLSELSARKVHESDFEKFDYVLAMDRDNFKILDGLCPKERKNCLSLFLDFAQDLPVKEVPDPYYGGTKGFDRVLDMIEQASDGLLEHIKSKHQPSPGGRGS